MTAAPSSFSLSHEPSAGPPLSQLVQIRDLIYGVAGIFQPDNKLKILEDHCLERMQALGVDSLGEYFECLTVKPIQQAEMVSLLNEITIGETFFFRNQPQLDALRNVAIMRIVEAKAATPQRHLRIWSAGCSTGEEPYTLSMIMLEETAGKLQGWTFEILATDLNQESLAHCEHGAYSGHSTQNLTPYFEQKYFMARGDGLVVGPEARAHVSFRRVNLLDDAGMASLRDIDVILCCNVLIYFDALSKQRVLRHFHESLLPHGYLFLGHSESLYGVSAGFDLVHLPYTTAYVKDQKQPANP
jgi:chemotaxis protein methyltransferase CheR